ncbi:MAG: TadE/TadG family type IV pilus assembly protein, partial [Actinomycetota bacterium]
GDGAIMSDPGDGAVVSDRGDMAVEAAIVAPVLFFLMFAGLLVAGRSIQAKNQAESAAQEAARAASLEQTPAAATEAGNRALEANVSDTTGMDCAATINAASLEPGSIVEVRVDCRADLVAGRQATFTATAFEVVDQYRQGEES